MKSAMIGEVIKGAYDTEGKRVFEPRKKRYVLFAPTFPLGRYLNRPLSVRCSNFDDLQHFLKQCRYITDDKQFGKKDFWVPPEEFEQRRKGDCEDFALWTWRQLMAMGYDARFVLGRAGKYGSGHAWVAFIEDGRWFLVEPCAAWLDKKLPRLSTVRYKPELSVAWKDDRLQYYDHHDLSYNPTFREILPLVYEWVVINIKCSPKILSRGFRKYSLWAVSFGKWGIRRVKKQR